MPKGFENKNVAVEAGKKSTRAGVPNKSTTALRSMVSKLLNDNYEQIMDDIKQLEPKERIDAWIKLLEYALPKLQRTESRIDLTSLSNEQVEAMIDKILQDE